MNSADDGAVISPAPVATSTPSSRLAWTQVVLASVLMVSTLPGRTHGLGLITKPLMEDLHLDGVTYANLNLWATLLGALFCFPAGWAIDRLGLRWVTAAMSLLLGIIVWRISNLAGGVMTLFVLLLATRAFGQSALSVCSITTVGRWFPQHSGMAMGAYSVLMSVLFGAAFGVVTYSIRQNGWRAAWLHISLALIFFITPLVLFALREPSTKRPSSAVSPSNPAEVSFTLVQALRSGAFWIFAGAAALFNLVSSGLSLFNEAVLAERGFDQKTFHLFFTVTPIIALVGQFACGWMMRHWRHRVLIMVALVLYAAGLAGIPVLQTAWQLWVVAAFIGIAGGMIIVIFFSVWSDLFGQHHLGRIQGAAQMLTVISSALGPVLFAKCYELHHSYAPLLFLLAAAVLLLAAVAFLWRQSAGSTGNTHSQNA